MHLHKEVQVTTENAIKCNLTSTELVMLKAGKQRCFVFFSLALLTIQFKKILLFQYKGHIHTKKQVLIY